MKKLKANKRKKQGKGSGLNKAVLIDFSHRLAFFSGEFDPKGASFLVNDCTKRVSSTLELFKTQFDGNTEKSLNNDVLCHVLFSVMMELGDISALMAAFEKAEKGKHSVFNGIWQNLANMKQVIKKLCVNLAKGDADESNKNICNSIDAVQIDLANVAKLFSELCTQQTVKNRQI